MAQTPRGGFDGPPCGSVLLPLNSSWLIELVVLSHVPEDGSRTDPQTTQAGVAPARPIPCIACRRDWSDPPCCGRTRRMERSLHAAFGWLRELDPVFIRGIFIYDMLGTVNSLPCQQVQPSVASRHTHTHLPEESEEEGFQSRVACSGPSGSTNFMFVTFFLNYLCLYTP